MFGRRRSLHAPTPFLEPYSVSWRLIDIVLTVLGKGCRIGTVVIGRSQKLLDLNTEVSYTFAVFRCQMWRKAV